MTTSILLHLYRLTTTGLRPLVPMALHWRKRQGMEDRHRLRERMGVAGLPRPDGRLIWIHAASVEDGEALLPLVEKLSARGFHILVSTRTLTSANVLKRQLPAGAFHQFMPIDILSYVERFLDHWQPDMVLLAGAELWPNVLTATNERGLPIIFVNARLTDRIYQKYCRVRRFAKTLMECIDLVLTQTDIDAERFFELGATSVQTVGDLIFDRAMPAADPAALSTLSTRIGARPVWVAALTDPSDHAFILEVHRQLLRRYPDVVTIVAPRLPRDGIAFAQIAAEQNFDTILRSRDGFPNKLPGLYVADVGGEMGLLYRIGCATFIGHSLTGEGHSPIEAAKLGCAVLHGPRVEKFADLYAALDKAQGAAMVKDAATLVRVLALLFDDGNKLRLMQRNAKQTIERLCGGTTRVMRAIEPHMVQLMVDR